MQNINAAGLEAVGLNKQSALGLLGGDVFKCVNAARDEGCGHTPDCAFCPVRSRVTETFQTKQALHNKRGELQVYGKDNAVVDFKFIISTEYMMIAGEESVLVTLSEIPADQDASKRTVLALLNHELRTPLNPIIAGSEHLINISQDPEVVDCLQMIHTSGKRLYRMIQRVLDYSEVLEGTIELWMRPESLVDTLQIVESRVELLNTDQLAFSIKNHSTVDHYFGDSCRVCQILEHLLANACKFTLEGSVELVVENNETHICFKVIDTGIGIAPKELKNIYNIFYQSDASSTREFSGMGVGLSLCHKLSEIMGCTLHAQSTLGKGSCFTLEVPIKG